MCMSVQNVLEISTNWVTELPVSFKTYGKALFFLGFENCPTIWISGGEIAKSLVFPVKTNITQFRLSLAQWNPLRNKTTCLENLGKILSTLILTLLAIEANTVLMLELSK